MSKIKFFYKQKKLKRLQTMKKTIKKYCAALLLFSLCLASCSPNLDMKDIHTNAVPLANDTASWQYDASSNNITMPSYKGGDIELNLNGYLLIDNPKGGLPVAALPIAEPNPTKGAYSRTLTINGERARGFLIGKYNDKIVLELRLEMGRRCGSFFGITNAGKEYRPSPTDEIIPCPSDMNSVRKPVIYLYPTTRQVVNVQVNFNGELTHTYPKYPAQGWTVTAQPTGELKDEQTGKIYYQLFWEGQSTHRYNMNEGFVVKNSETADFLDEKLAVLGLNRREANEFITYWLPELEQNEYNFIHFADAEYKNQARLTIKPAADTEIRVFMVYEALGEWKKVNPQILKSPVRKGFTLVEWGGAAQKQAIK